MNTNLKRQIWRIIFKKYTNFNLLNRIKLKELEYKMKKENFN